MQTFTVLLPGLFRMSCQASIIILLVLAGQWLCGARLKPRWRYMLWGLVMLRLALPWSIPFPSSFLSQVKLPVVLQVVPPEKAPAAAADARVPNTEGDGSAMTAPTSSGHLVLWLWGTGVIILAGFAILNHHQFHKRIARQRPLVNETALNLLEDCKTLMGVRVPVALVETNAVQSPTLFGFVRPRLLLPAGFLANFNREELRHVFLHELAHLKRHDILTGWLALVLQAVHWFNPLVWLAFYRMRVDRELACDSLALSYSAAGENESYGLTIVKLLDGFGQSGWRPGLAGILENKQQMKERIRMIAKFYKKERGLALAVFVLAGLMLATLTLSCRRSAETTPATTPPTATPPVAAATQAAEADNADAQGPPQIVATSPSVGATEVDPTITELTVTFDRDMGTGFSWTGGGPDFPAGPEGEKAHWRDLRTCILPVKLEAGHYYRVGINSMSYQGFQSAKGVSAQPSAIYFTTRGASQALQRKTALPQIVGLNPKNGSMDVDPKLAEIRVTFSVAMGDGCSWTGGGSDFPKIPDGKRPYWTADHMTCVLPVELQPVKTYQFGLNSPSHKNFQSSGGVPLDPVTVTFRTRDD